MGRLDSPIVTGRVFRSVTSLSASDSRLAEKLRASRCWGGVYLWIRDGQGGPVAGYYGSRVEHLGAGRRCWPFKLSLRWQKRRAASFFKVPGNCDPKPDARPGTRSDLPGRQRHSGRTYWAGCRCIAVRWRCGEQAQGKRHHREGEKLSRPWSARPWHRVGGRRCVKDLVGR